MYFSSTRISPNRRALGDSAPFAGVAVVCAGLACAVTTGPPLGWRGGSGPRLKWLTTLGSRLKSLTVPSRTRDRGIQRAERGPRVDSLTTLDASTAPHPG